MTKSKISPRVYKFTLPYVVSGFQMGMTAGIVRGSGLVEKLPKDLQRIILDCEANWAAFVITEKMCNEIDDITWERIADLLHLKWDYVSIVPGPEASTTIVETTLTTIKK